MWYFVILIAGIVIGYFVNHYADEHEAQIAADEERVKAAIAADIAKAKSKL